MRLLSARDFYGNMAKWAVSQHPYYNPPRLIEVTQAIIDGTSDWVHGSASFKLRWFEDASDAHKWIKKVVPADIMEIWNTRANGNDSPYGFSSRYDSPSPENDFIDIDALLGNVSRSAWNDGEDCESQSGQQE